MLNKLMLIGLIVCTMPAIIHYACMSIMFPSASEAKKNKSVILGGCVGLVCLFALCALLFGLAGLWLEATVSLALCVFFQSAVSILIWARGIHVRDIALGEWDQIIGIRRGAPKSFSRGQKHD